MPEAWKRYTLGPFGRSFPIKAIKGSTPPPPPPLLYFFLLWHWFCVFLASTADYYRVDKEDIVIGDTQETAPPPALPPVAQTLPSQPLDVLFIERRGGLTSVLSNIPLLCNREREKIYFPSCPSDKHYIIIQCKCCNLFQAFSRLVPRKKLLCLWPLKL